jgi:hypothetical protein
MSVSKVVISVSFVALLLLMPLLLLIGKVGHSYTCSASSDDICMKQVQAEPNLYEEGAAIAD